MIASRFKRIASAALTVAFATSLMVPQGAYAASLKISGSTTVQPLAQKWATAYKKLNPSWSISVAGGGSGTGFKDAEAGRVNVGMSSRDPKQSELDSGLQVHVVARDALAVVVNPGNPVRKLTEAQVRDIYHGKITNWKQVGGPNRRIVVCGRTGASGTYEYFKEAFLLGKRQSSATKGYASNGMVRSAVARNSWAIGYVGLAFVNKSVRGVSVGGVSPTMTNAVSGKYKYVRKLYFITKGAPTGDTKKFIDWCRASTGGQKHCGPDFLKR